MILRTYRTRIDPANRAAFEAFERDEGLPMVRSMPGCLAAGFGPIPEAGEPTYLFVSLWESREKLEKARATGTWKRVVAKLERQGLSRGGDVAEHVELVAWEPDPKKR